MKERKGSVSTASDDVEVRQKVTDVYPPTFDEIITRPRVKPIDCTLTNQNEMRRPQWFSVGRKERRAVAMTQMICRKWKTVS